MNLEFHIWRFASKFLLFYSSAFGGSLYVVSLVIWWKGKEYKIIHWWKYKGGHLLYFFNRKKVFKI